MELIEKIKNIEEFGIVIKDYKLNFPKAVKRKNKIVQELIEGIKALEKAWKNDVYHGFGKIMGGDISSGFTISIKGQDNKTINAKRVIIATGSSPALIPNFNIDHKRILTTDDILEPTFTTIPKRLLIIGAGVSGCEFAIIFSSFGSKITMLEFFPSPIATEESLIIKEFQKKLVSEGIELYTSQNVLSVENTGSGVKAITCSSDVTREEINTAEKTFFEAEYCLVTNGRKKESKNLGLEELGIKTERGAIKVNPDTLETNVKGVYAIGDVTGGLMLAHVASYEGKIAVANALTSIGGFPVKEMKTNYLVIPSTIWTYPIIGSVGLRRKVAKNQGIDVLMGTFPYQSLGKAKCMGEEDGFLMVLANKVSQKIIGASCIGAEAPELIAEIALAMQHGLTVQDIADTIHSHPTLSEMVLEGVESVVGLAIHKKGRPIHL